MDDTTIECKPSLSRAFEHLCEHASDWNTSRVLDEGLDLARDAVWADACVLHRVRGDQMVEVARRPVDRAAGATPHAEPLDRFPWDLAPVQAERFLLVSDARGLPVHRGASVTFGSLGVRSCLHLPILERDSPVGALHLYWSGPRLAWDDDRGRVLRSLGRFLIAATDARPGADRPADT